MSNLIDELKKEHSAIVDMLKKVNELGVTSKAGQNLLMSAKNGLLAHLKKEDEKLYPILRKAAESDKHLKMTMEMLAKDMEVISKVALQFFEKYAHGGSGIEFAKDFGKLLAELGGRIRKEESLLYVEYDKLSRGPHRASA